MPVLIPAPIPGFPLLKLFSNVERHMAHCAADETTFKKKIARKIVNAFISLVSVIRTDHQINDYSRNGYV